MAETGFVLAGAGANVNPGSGTSWSNPGNITADNTTTYTSANSVPGSGTSQLLRASSFGFVIPAGASIVGIEARWQVSPNSPSSGDFVSGGTDHTIQLVNASGSQYGSNYANTSSNYSAAIGTRTYGGAADLWSVTPSAEDINDSDFGFVARVTNTSSKNAISFRAYRMWMNIHYEEAPAGNSGAFFMLFSMADRIREILKPKQRFWMPEAAF